VAQKTLLHREPVGTILPLQTDSVPRYGLRIDWPPGQFIVASFRTGRFRARLCEHPIGLRMNPITPQQRNALLLADRSRDVHLVYEAVVKVTEDNPALTLLDIELVFRDAAGNSYLVIGEDGTLRIVFGMLN
jgi:hypothetical protein